MRRAASSLLLLAIAVLAPAACDDPFGPRERPVPEEPSTATLHDFSGGDLREPSAFDVLGARPIRTDLSSGWDFVFTITPAGEALFRPRSVVLDEDVDSGLQRVGSSFEELEMAPESGYVRDESVPVEEGAVYVAVSRQDPAFRSITCHRFLKLEVLSLDLQQGTVEFRYLGNPNCEQRILVPGEGGSE